MTTPHTFTCVVVEPHACTNFTVICGSLEDLTHGYCSLTSHCFSLADGTGIEPATRSFGDSVATLEHARLLADGVGFEPTLSALTVQRLANRPPAIYPG